MEKKNQILFLLVFHIADVPSHFGFDLLSHALNFKDALSVTSPTVSFALPATLLPTALISFFTKIFRVNVMLDQLLRRLKLSLLIPL